MRHDLLRTDWLQTVQRTRSLSCDRVYFNGTVNAGVQFASCGVNGRIRLVC